MLLPLRPLHALHVVARATAPKARLTAGVVSSGQHLERFLDWRCRGSGRPAGSISSSSSSSSSSVACGRRRGLATNSKGGKLFTSGKLRKGKQDAQRASFFGKLCGEVWAAAREGGTDPATNYRLSLAIQRCRDNSVPKANMERAVKRANAADEMEEILYELYAPAGVGMLVLATTDSRNRMIREIKGCINRHDGASLGSEGAVSWQFQRTGLLRVGVSTAERADALLEFCIDNGATDVHELGAPNSQDLSRSTGAFPYNP